MVKAPLARSVCKKNVQQARNESDNLRRQMKSWGRGWKESGSERIKTEACDFAFYINIVIAVSERDTALIAEDFVNTYSSLSIKKKKSNTLAILTASLIHLTGQTRQQVIMPEKNGKKKKIYIQASILHECYNPALYLTYSSKA